MLLVYNFNLTSNEILKSILSDKMHFLYHSVQSITVISKCKVILVCYTIMIIFHGFLTTLFIYLIIFQHKLYSASGVCRSRLGVIVHHHHLLSFRLVFNENSSTHRVKERENRLLIRFFIYWIIVKSYIFLRLPINDLIGIDIRIPFPIAVIVQTLPVYRHILTNSRVVKRDERNLEFNCIRVPCQSYFDLCQGCVCLNIPIVYLQCLHGFPIENLDGLDCMVIRSWILGCIKCIEVTML